MAEKLVSDLSEGELLGSFLPIISDHNRAAGASALMVGPGDDCAVLDLSSAPTVMTTDTLTENQDFRQLWRCGYRHRGYDLGWKAATQNLADVASMGAAPVTLLVSMSIPATLPVSWVSDFARGLVDSCVASGASTCTIAGGDLGRSQEISITVTAVGRVLDRPVLRSGAQDGDRLAVAGRLGFAAAGLALLDSPSPLSADSRLQEVVAGQVRPAGAVQAGVRASSSATAMMDVSDGLVRDARRIAQASGVKIDISSEALAPFISELEYAAGALGNPDLARHWVLTGGEDHAMLATFSGELPEGFIAIGTCSAGAETGVSIDGHQPSEAGWDHFKTT